MLSKTTPRLRSVRAGDEWFSMDLDVVRPVIKDVSHATFQVTQEVTRVLFV